MRDRCILEMNSILLTGATGFVASHLMPLLLQNGWSVVAAVRKDTHQLPAITAVNVGNIDGNTDWHHALSNIDTVIHLAARAHILQEQVSDPEAEFLKVNTQGTVNLVKGAIAANVRHFVFISSIGAMTSQSDSILTESSPSQPDTPYGRSKLLAEQALISLASQSSMSWTILRPPLVYGAGNPGNMERLIKLVQKGLPLPFGAIKNRRSLIYVGNLVDAITSTLNHPQAANQTFLVSDGEDLSTPELIQKIATNLNQPCYLLSIPPNWLQLGGKLGDTVQNFSKKQLPLNTSTVERLLGNLAIDSSHIQTTLNWQPPFTVDEGLAQTLLSLT